MLEEFDRRGVTRLAVGPMPDFKAHPTASACHIRGIASLVAATLALAGLLLRPAGSQAQITTNITSSGLGTIVSQSGTTFNITGGTARGPNLFHSFGLLDVGAGNTANFNNTTGSNFTNILGRVTGGQTSNIFGQIRTTNFGTADLYLINPAGFIFGSTATLNVGGAFRVSTADNIRFADLPGGTPGGTFSANTSPLPASGLITNPVAFGFLGSTTPAAISVQSSRLQVATGKTLSLVGGPIQIVGAGGTSPPITLGAASGRVEIASVASGGEVTLGSAQAPDVGVASFSSLGRIDLSNGARIDVSGVNGPGGTVVIRGGQLVAAGPSTGPSRILANTTGSTNGAPTAVDIQVRGTLEMKEGAFINSVTSRGAAGGGDGGAISVSAGTLSLSSGASIASISAHGGFPPGDGGRGGDVTVTATDSVILDGANTSLSTSTQSALSSRNGAGGRLSVSAPSLTLDHGASITTASTTFSRWPAGNLEVNVGTLSLTNGANLGSHATGAGAAGSTTVNVTGSGTINGSGSPILTTGIRSDSSGSGSIGGITVNAGQLAIEMGGVIQSGISVPGNRSAGGAVTVNATDSIAISGLGGISSQALSGGVGNVSVSAPSLFIDNGFISTSTSALSSAGAVSVNAGTLTLTGGGQINSSSVQGASGAGGDVRVTATGSVSISGRSASSPSDRANAQSFSTDLSSGLFSTASGAGPGGQIEVSAPTLTMGEGGRISAATSSSLTTGVAGNIELNLGTFSLTGGAQVSSSTTGAGRGGSVALTAMAGTSLAGAGSGLFSTTQSTRQDAGSAGRIIVTTPTLGLSDGGAISVATSGAGAAGDIALNLGHFTLTGGARVDSSTTGAGQGGTIAINAPVGMVLSGGSGLFSTAGGSGAGGDINVTAGQVQLLGGGTISAQSTGTATALAGNVDVTSGSLFRMQDSTIATGATLADGGNISIRTNGTFWMTDSRITTSVQSGEGRGGNITIDPQFVLLNRSQIRADAFGGPGGNITITAGVFLASPDSILSASSALSAPGTIEIQATVTDVSGNVARLPESPLQAATLLRAACASRLSGGKLSSLVVAGRGGVPPEPHEMLPSLLADEAPAGPRFPAGAGQRWETFARLPRFTLSPSCAR